MISGSLATPVKQGKISTGTSNKEVSVKITSSERTPRKTVQGVPDYIRVKPRKRAAPLRSAKSLNAPIISENKTNGTR